MSKISDDQRYKLYEEHQMDSEAIWDAMAENYNSSQNSQGMQDSCRVAEFMHQKKRLMNDEVLDVGGGAGLYAIPLAKYAKMVTITDISSNMLTYAKENADAAGLKNVNYIKLDWEKANLKELGWENRFDLVFASMCPAIREGGSIDKMMTASKNWCSINRIIKMKDSVAEKIVRKIKPSEQSESHNNREKTQRIFNYLWEKGYEPEMDYFEETTEKIFTVEEALIHYRKHFESISENQRINLKEIISDIAEGNTLKTVRYKKLALLSWQV